MNQDKAKNIIPKWMECTWRRQPCDKESCPICGRIKRDRAKHLAQGEDPNSIETVLEDVSNNFKKALAMIKADAEAKGFDITNIDNIQEPPEPDQFPLYLKVKNWRNDIYRLAEQAEENLDAWPELEVGKDLLWYVNTVIAKTYRQLCNRWHIEQGDDYGEEDYQYTQHVLNECLLIIRKSLNDLIKMYPEQKKFNIILIIITGLEPELLKI